MSMTRRDFVGGAISLAALVGMGGASKAFGDQSSTLRPPGGQDEDSFISACIRCDRCRSVCLQNCIGVGTTEDGFINVRTPMMDFHQGGCTFCMRCIDVCPTQALSRDAYAAIGCAQVQKSRCVAWRNPGSCAVCADVCPKSAIEMDGGVPVVDRQACDGCGICVLRCPALSMLSLRQGTSRGIEVRPFSEVDAQGTTVEGEA